MASGQPRSNAEGLFLFYTVVELIVHTLLLYSALYYTIGVINNIYGPGSYFIHYHCSPNGYDSCCNEVTQWFSITVGMFTGMSIAVPLFGLLSIYFMDYFWFQEIYLASVCLSVQSILQDRETVARLGIPEIVCERLQERSQEFDNELLKHSIGNFRREASFTQKLVHYCENPCSAIYSFFLVCFLTSMFCSYGFTLCIF